jgi:hypothetical protein
MAKEQNGNKKYQINIFAGSQSFIMRDNSLATVAKFMGVNGLTSEIVVSYLQALNVKLGQFDGAVVQVKSSKREKRSEQTELPHALDNNFLVQIQRKLVSLGAKTEKVQVKMLAKKTGIKVKRLGDLIPAQMQQALLLLLRGKK